MLTFVEASQRKCKLTLGLGAVGFIQALDVEEEGAAEGLKLVGEEDGGQT